MFTRAAAVSMMFRAAFIKPRGGDATGFKCPERLYNGLIPIT